MNVVRVLSVCVCVCVCVFGIVYAREHETRHYPIMCTNANRKIATKTHFWFYIVVCVRRPKAILRKYRGW